MRGTRSYFYFFVNFGPWIWVGSDNQTPTQRFRSWSTLTLIIFASWFLLICSCQIKSKMFFFLILDPFWGHSGSYLEPSGPHHLAHTEVKNKKHTWVLLFSAFSRAWSVEPSLWLKVWIQIRLKSDLQEGKGSGHNVSSGEHCVCVPVCVWEGESECAK